MATTLRELTQHAVDLYYQDYAPRDAFFDKSDFMFHVAVYYSAQLNALFQQMRRETKKEDGFQNTELSASWLIEEKLTFQWNEELEERYAKTKFDIFSFDFDTFSNGFQGMRPAPKDKGRKFRKVSLNELKFLPLLPTSGNTFYNICGKNKIVVTCPVEEAIGYYIPVVVGNDENCVLSDNIAADVIKNVLQIMFGAKNGNVIAQADDGNKNDVLPQQVNPQLK